MRKLFSLLILSGVFLFSCQSEPEPKEDKPLTNEEIINQTDINVFDDMELYFFMEQLEKQLIDQESLEVSKNYSMKMLNSAQVHVEKFPTSEYRREAIRKGSRAAQGLNNDLEAIRLIDIAIKENSTDSTIIEEMNLRAFLFDKLNNKEKAKEAYQEVIDKFPNHPSVANHKERLKTIDLTDEELIELFQSNNAE